MMLAEKSRRAFQRFTGCQIFAAVLACLGAATPAQSQSLFDCTSIHTGAVPMVEGHNGTFFRIDPDLMMFHPLTDATLARIAELESILADLGTQFILLPLPTKAQVVAGDLPERAEILGYDAKVAAILYQDMIRRASDAGITVANARDALVEVQNQAPAYFQTDARLTNEGLRGIAELISAEFDLLASSSDYVTIAKGQQTLASEERDTLQLRCIGRLPTVTTTDFETINSDDTGVNTAQRIAIVGDITIGGDARNFAGFMSEFTGMAASTYTANTTTIRVLESYFTSADYAQGPPAVLIWALPIWDNIALGGDQPMRAAKAAALGRCERIVSSGREDDGAYLYDIAEFSLDPIFTLNVSTSEFDTQSVEFDFKSKTGATRSRRVLTDPELPASGNFFMPLSGLWQDGAAQVAITLYPTSDVEPALAVCEGDK